ncbi:hypothetical protein B4Q13_22785, partial [Lacticaseibacillus rhamnosus]
MPSNSPEWMPRVTNRQSMPKPCAPATSVRTEPPIANTQFYVLDSHQELVPYGVPGELFIGGDGGARGYFDLPEMTTEKVIADKYRSV